MFRAGVSRCGPCLLFRGGWGLGVIFVEDKYRLCDLPFTRLEGNLHSDRGTADGERPWLMNERIKEAARLIASRSHDTLNTTRQLSTGTTLPVDEYVV